MACSRGRDLNARRRLVEQAPMGGRAAMAQHGALAAREHRRETPPLDPQHSAADGVDAVVEALEPTHVHAPLDRAAAEPEREQLGARHDAPLPRSQLGHPPIRGRAPKCIYYMGLRAHARSVTENPQQGTPQTSQFCAATATYRPYERPITSSMISSVP